MGFIRCVVLSVLAACVAGGSWGLSPVESEIPVEAREAAAWVRAAVEPVEQSEAYKQRLEAVWPMIDEAFETTTGQVYARLSVATLALSAGAIDDASSIVESTGRIADNADTREAVVYTRFVVEFHRMVAGDANADPERLMLLAEDPDLSPAIRDRLRVMAGWAGALRGSSLLGWHALRRGVESAEARGDTAVVAHGSFAMGVVIRDPVEKAARFDRASEAYAKIGDGSESRVARVLGDKAIGGRLDDVVAASLEAEEGDSVERVLELLSMYLTVQNQVEDSLELLERADAMADRLASQSDADESARTALEIAQIALGKGMVDRGVVLPARLARVDLGAELMADMSLSIVYNPTSRQDGLTLSLKVDVR